MLKIISSMATRQLLAELAAVWQNHSGVKVSLESVGGVDAARRVQAGEAFDGVVLASQAIDLLMADGRVVAGSRHDLMRSCVAVAVRAGAPLPDISTESALRNAVEAASTIGYSSGPSGVAIVKLFERWGMSAALRARVVQTPPGIPVGTLVARGEVALGFQQLSELMHLGGITVLGTLPEAVRITTIFSAGVCTLSAQRSELAAFLHFMQTTGADVIKQRHGMDAISLPAA